MPDESSRETTQQPQLRAGDSRSVKRRTATVLRALCRRSFLLASFAAAAMYLGAIFLARFWPLELLTHFRVQFAVILNVLLITQLVWWTRRWSLAFILIAASAWLALIPYGPWARQQVVQPSELRIMSVNLQNSNLLFEKFPALLREVNPDLLVLIEYTYLWDQQLQEALSDYPYQSMCPRELGFGLAVFSKVPLEDVRKVQLITGLDAPTIFCDVMLNGQAIHFAAVHTMSPLSATRFRVRNEQLQRIGRQMAQVSGPRIVAGDLNASTWSPFVRELLSAGRLRDSRIGMGLQTTWPQFSWPMGVAIDHFLISPEIRVHAQWVERDIGSDHFPIVIDVSITPSEIEAFGSR